MAQTRIPGEQLRFVSSKTGTQVLDDYLEACEFGNRPLSDILAGLVDANGDPLLNAINSWESDWVAATAYQKGDVFRDGDALSATYLNVYVVKLGHTSDTIANDEAANKIELLIDAVTIKTYRDDALTAKANAETAETNAETAETNAETAETNATTQAGVATTQAGLASASAAAASASAIAAAASEAAAAAVVNGVMWRDVVYKTFADSPLTLDSTYGGKLVAIDTTGGAVTVNLPSIAALTLPWSVAVQLQAGSNAITIARNGTDTIMGAASTTLASDDEGCILVADNSASPDDWTRVGFGAAVANGSITLAKLADLATQRLIGRNTGSTGVPEAVTTTQVLDWLHSTRGGILTRGASAWAGLAIGTNGKALCSDGTDAAWAYVAGTNIRLGSDAQGDILYFNGTDYVRLPAGTSGQYLKTLGAGGNPLWATVSAGAWAFVSSSACSGTSVDFTSLATDGDYLFEVDGLYASADITTFDVRIQQAGSFQTTNYESAGWTGGRLDMAGGAVSVETGVDTGVSNRWRTGVTCNTSSTDGGITGQLMLHNPGSTTMRPRIDGQLSWVNGNNGSRYSGLYYGQRTTTGAVTGIRFGLGTFGSTMGGGTIRCYRRVHS